MKHAPLLIWILAFATGSFGNLAAAQVSIDPAPSSSDDSVTVLAPTDMATDPITLYTATSPAACIAEATPVKLGDTNNTVSGDGKTVVAITAGSLSSGIYICAGVKVKGEDEPTLSTPVQVKAAGAVPVADVRFEPVPTIKYTELHITTPNYLKGDTLTVMTANTAETCATSKTTLGASDTPINSENTMVTITSGVLKVGSYVCVAVKDASGKSATTQAVAVRSGCADNSVYSDCTYEFTLIGGVEQSGLSAQNSMTNGFYDLFIRRPVGSKWAGIWFRSRFLGAPSTSSTNNVVAAATNPTGTLTTSNLPQSIIAVDYVLGLQLANNIPWGTPTGRFTVAPVIGFGATTPLDASTVVNGFQVPQIGTNECNQLQVRFSSNKGYNPPIPGSGYYPNSSGNVVQGCVVEPPANATTATTTNPGTQITAIAFSNEDRSNFLLKWGVGLRLLDRYSPTCLTTSGCPRMRADFSIGQDQAITAGYWRHLVFKADAVIPIFSTGTYFFASSANRLAGNQSLSPLILTPVTVNSGSSSSCTASSTSTTSVCVPSPNVFVLPYKQPDRDFYRIGIGIDAVKLLSKLFTPSS